MYLKHICLATSIFIIYNQCPCDFNSKEMCAQIMWLEVTRPDMTEHSSSSCLQQELHYCCHMSNRKSLHIRRLWFNFQLLVLLNFSVLFIVLYIIVCPFVPFLLASVFSLALRFRLLTILLASASYSSNLFIH